MSEGNVSGGIAALPPIKRARLWRLYAQDGRRFLDLCQDGGRAVLGAKPGRIHTSAKAAIDQGLTRPLPSIWTGRLEKELKRRYPEHREIRLYANEEEARRALTQTLSANAAFSRPDAPPREAASPLFDPCRVRDTKAPASIPSESPFCLFGRPFANYLAAPPRTPDAILVCLPCPQAFSPGILLFASPTLSRFATAGSLVAPLLARSALEALCALDRYIESIGEAYWKRADRSLASFFERRGPWLFPRIEREKYPALFEKALAKGVLLSEDYEQPSILPGDFDDGELAPLAKLEL